MLRLRGMLLRSAQYIKWYIFELSGEFKLWLVELLVIHLFKPVHGVGVL